jgi:hypothetical protein
MLNCKDNSEHGTPLVRERSVVQSHAAAPAKCLCGIDYRDCRRPYCPPLHDATEREHAPTRRAESVRDVREAFAARATPDHWPSMCVLFYLQMPVLPAALKPLALAAIDDLAREMRQGRL